MADPIDYERKFKAAREEFLNLLADGKWHIEYDADLTETGRQIDCSTYHIDGRIEALDYLCAAFDIKPHFGQSLEDALTEAVETPSDAT